MSISEKASTQIKKVGEKERSTIHKCLAHVVSYFIFLVLIPVAFLRLDDLLYSTPLFTKTECPICMFSLGVFMLFAGLGLIAWTAWTQGFHGKGTPLHTCPPKRLVDTGPYTIIRNPMGAGITLYYIGWGLLMASYPILLVFIPLYSSIGFIWLVKIEEKELEKRFGEEYKEYKKRVPRLIPKL